MTVAEFGSQCALVRVAVTKPVARNVQKGETAALLRELLEVYFDENLNGLLARIDLDANGARRQVNLMASSVGSSNYGVGHWVWLSEFSGVGLAKRLSGRRIRGMFGRSMSEADQGRGVRLASAPDCRR